MSWFLATFGYYNGDYGASGKKKMLTEKYQLVIGLGSRAKLRPFDLELQRSSAVVRSLLTQEQSTFENGICSWGLSGGKPVVVWPSAIQPYVKVELVRCIGRTVENDMLYCTQNESMVWEHL